MSDMRQKKMQPEIKKGTSKTMLLLLQDNAVLFFFPTM